MISKENFIYLLLQENFKMLPSGVHY